MLALIRHYWRYGSLRYGAGCPAFGEAHTLWCEGGEEHWLTRHKLLGRLYFEVHFSMPYVQ